MNKRNLFIGVAALGFSAFCGTSALAQTDVTKLLITSNKDDLTKLGQTYLNPLFKGLTTGLNSGWNNTAKTKKFGRFDIRVSASGAFIPASDQLFDITQIGLSSNIRPSDPNKVTTPTVAGSNNQNDAAMVDVYDGSTLVQSNVNLPSGTGLDIAPAPQIQATIGLPKGIDATIRFVPSIKLGDKGAVRMIGGGLKVNLMQFINCKKVDKLNPFDLALAAGYTQINYDLDLNVQANGSNYTNQSLSGKISGFSIETIISKKLSFFTPFASVGYNSSKINIDLKGDYPIDVANTGTNTVVSNPFTIDTKGINGLRGNVGFQLELFILRLYASYTVAHYNSVNAGIGLGI